MMKKLSDYLRKKINNQPKVIHPNLKLLKSIVKKVVSKEIIMKILNYFKSLIKKTSSKSNLKAQLQQY